MKRIVLVFGLIAGVILSVSMVVSLQFHDAIGFGPVAMAIGYASMVLAFLLVYFGVRAYRDEVAGGTVGFGRAFAVGGLIALVASLCYVATWQVIYYRFEPDFMVKYQAHVLEKARASGASAEALARQKADMESFAKLYRNPAFNAAVTFAEPLPVALIIALVSAGVLSRKRREDEGLIAPVRVST